jgi:hypothetical protein
MKLNGIDMSCGVSTQRGKAAGTDHPEPSLLLHTSARARAVAARTGGGGAKSVGKSARLQQPSSLATCTAIEKRCPSRSWGGGGVEKWSRRTWSRRTQERDQ